jgi:very-short-patch-repair endonuclease
MQSWCALGGDSSTPFTAELVRWDDRYPEVTAPTTRTHRGIRVHRSSMLATGHAPTRSELEDAVLDLILAGGFRHPDVNRSLSLSGRRVIPDFRWPEQRLVIEADGAEWHDNRLAREDDAERQALLEAHSELHEPVLIRTDRIISATGQLDQT